MNNKEIAGKPTFHLLPWPVLAEVNAVFEYGAKKYGVNNWMHAMPWSGYFNAAIRHLWKWWFLREKVDAESGLSHLAHAASCCLILLHLVSCTGGEFDDRPGDPVPF